MALVIFSINIGKDDTRDGCQMQNITFSAICIGSQNCFLCIGIAIDNFTQLHVYCLSFLYSADFNLKMFI